MNRIRTCLAAALAVASLTGVLTPAAADPDAVAAARADLERIQQEASALDQQIIEASVRAEEGRANLSTVTADLRAQEAKVAALSDELGDIALAQFQSRGMDVTAHLFTSDSDASFLTGLATIQNEAERSNASLQDLQVEQAAADRLRSEAAAASAALDADLKAKHDLAAAFDAKEAEAEAVYSRLDAEEKERLRQLELEREREQEEADRRAREQAGREREQARTTSTARTAEQPADRGATPAAEDEPVHGSGGGSERAQRAVEVALAQVGKRYVWGTSGPHTFDCSGLTSYAYRQVGISISRSSRAQLGVGRPVAKSDLQPGDLVFYYSPVSHVGIYIGNGKIVDAANPRRGVRVTSLNSMPFAGARRVVG